jgi:maltose O-acetyltransferase
LATEKQKMLAGELYVATGEELAADARRAAEWMDRYNASLAHTQRDHAALLRELFAEVGEGAYIRPPFHCDYGYNISLGRGVFLNFNWGCPRKRYLFASLIQLLRVEKSFAGEP